MRIAIIGTRGIPNHYGGFEQITAQLSAGLVKKGHEVSVYCSHNHPYKASLWQGVHLIHCYNPEKLLKTAGQFIYDLNCIRHARKARFDVLLFMGYTSSSVWRRFFPKKTVIISNMDGLEWKRSKYSKPVQLFLKHAEWLAVQYSHFHIADSIIIKAYLDNAYGLNTTFISYGVAPRTASVSALTQYQLGANDYFMLMARMEPENNIEMILDGYVMSKTAKKMIVVGNTTNHYGQKLKKKYADHDGILFIGAVFDQLIVHSMRCSATIYFHGHSVGGTNPSLLEAMASSIPIAAHNNPFNQTVLGKDAFYFSTPADVAIIMTDAEAKRNKRCIENNLKKIHENHNWKFIVDEYDKCLQASYHQFTK